MTVNVDAGNGDKQITTTHMTRIGADAFDVDLGTEAR
jgi:hypothetical protein